MFSSPWMLAKYEYFLKCFLCPFSVIGNHFEEDYGRESFDYGCRLKR